MAHARSSALAALALAIGILTSALTACRSAPEPEAAPDHVYTVRGEVQKLPAQDGLFYVKHEAIDEFIGRDGEPAPMAAMTMPFSLRPGVGLAGIAPGTKIEMSVEVRWAARPAMQIAALTALPAEVELDLAGAH